MYVCCTINELFFNLKMHQNVISGGVYVFYLDLSGSYVTPQTLSCITGRQSRAEEGREGDRKEVDVEA